MKIVLINASARKNGATAKILNEFADNLSARGDVDIQSIALSDVKLDFCLGCCLCYKNGVCHIDDDAEMLSGMIDDADGVIVGSPTYVGGVSGQLKTFIDRGHFVFEQLLKGKYTVGVVTYENIGGGAALKALKKLFILSGAKRFDKLIVKLPFNADPIANPGIKARIKKKSDALYRSIEEKKVANVGNAIINFVGMRFGIKPFVRRKGDQYAGVKKHWDKRGIRYG